MRLKLVTGPAAEPFDATAATGLLKFQLRITGTSQDTQLAALAVVARQMAETYTHRAFINQTWEQYHDAWPNGNGFQLAKGRAQSLTSITYIDSADASDTVGAITDLATWEDPYPRITLKDGENWPNVTLRPHDGVIVRWVAGYGAAGTDMPQDLIHAIVMATVALYDGCPPEAMGLPYTVRNLLDPYVIDLV